jgi:hypothetical protein
MRFASGCYPCAYAHRPLAWLCALAGCAESARKYARLGIICDTVYGVVNGALFLLALRRAWPSLFSE